MWGSTHHLIRGYLSRKIFIKEKDLVKYLTRSSPKVAAHIYFFLFLVGMIKRALEITLWTPTYCSCHTQQARKKLQNHPTIQDLISCCFPNSTHSYSLLPLPTYLTYLLGPLACTCIPPFHLIGDTKSDGQLFTTELSTSIEPDFISYNYIIKQ